MPQTDIQIKICTGGDRDPYEDRFVLGFILCVSFLPAWAHMGQKRLSDPLNSYHRWL